MGEEEGEWKGGGGGSPPSPSCPPPSPAPAPSHSCRMGRAAGARVRGAAPFGWGVNEGRLFG